MPLTVCVVSRTRGKGKTALIERLTKRFTGEGLNVVTIKHISGSFDTAKKDTWRHLEAGAAMTVASTPTEIVTINRIKNPPLEKALDAVYVKPELIFVEGYKKSSHPKILCADTAEEAQEFLEGISNVVMVSGLISSDVEERRKFEVKCSKPPVYDFEGIVSALKEMLVDSISKGLPGLDCENCGYDSCRDLAVAILRGEATMEDCEVLSTNIVTLKVDGKNIPLGRFPQQIIKGMMTGAVGALKGVSKQPHRVELLLKADMEEGSSQ